MVLENVVRHHLVLCDLSSEQSMLPNLPIFDVPADISHQDSRLVVSHGFIQSKTERHVFAEILMNNVMVSNNTMSNEEFLADSHWQESS